MRLLTDKAVLPAGWKLSTVGEACQIRDELRFPLSVEQRTEMQGEYPYYGPTGILDHLNEYRVDGTFALIGEDGDHFLKYDEWPMTQLVSGQFNVNNHAHLIEGKDGCTTEWVFYFFHHVDLKPLLSLQGVGRYKLTRSALERLPIAVPPLAEQNAIAAVLSAWDRSIERTTALLAAKQRLKQGLMQQLLSGRRRFPGHSAKWRTCTIGDLLKEVRRYVPVKDSNQYRLVSVRRRSGGVFDRPPELGSAIGYSRLMTIATGDFLIARRQVIHGAMTIVSKRFDGAFVSDAYATLIPKDPSSLHMPFFDLLSQTPALYHAAFRCSYGVAIEKMVFNLEWFLREPVTIPTSIDEQRAIADMFVVLRREIRGLERRLAELKQQKRGLMQQLLTGQRRVPPSLLKKGANP